MELLSSERQRIQQLIERLQMASTHLTVPAEDSRGIRMVKNDIDFIAEELQDIVDESWHIREDEDDYNGFGYRVEYTNQSMMPKHEPEPEPECEHDKAYAGWILTSDPPKTQWICRKCLKQGADVGVYSSRDGEDYRKLLQEVIEKVVRGEK